MNLPEAAYDDDGNTLRLVVVGPASTATPSHHFEEDHIWRQIYDEATQAIRVVQV